MNIPTDNCPHDVIDYHGNFVTSAKNKKLAQIIAKHFSYSEPQMTVSSSGNKIAD